MVIIFDDFLTKKELQIVLIKVNAVKWPRFSPHTMKRVEFHSPMLEEKLCLAEDEDCLLSLYKNINEETNIWKWHKDISSPLKLKQGQIWTNNIIQIILYVGGDFTGGILKTKFEDIKPKLNRLVIMDPLTEYHKITPLNGTRFTITGFVYRYKELDT